MAKTKRHYPPSYIRYQIEHPAITVHMSKKLKEALDAVKRNRSYAQVILEVVNGTFNLEEELKKAPVTELVIKYINGFKEARERYAVVGICKKCGRKWKLWKDGICDLCHKVGLYEPTFAHFRDRDTAIFIGNSDFEKARVELPNPEKKIYESGRSRGYDKGYGEGHDEGYEEAEKKFKITYSCAICGKPIVIYPGDVSHQAAIKYLKEHRWGHGSCHEKKKNKS